MIKDKSASPKGRGKSRRETISSLYDGKRSSPKGRAGKKTSTGAAVG